MKKHSTSLVIKCKFEEAMVESLWFSSFLFKLFILLPFPPTYVYTPLGRRTTISALYPLAPEVLLDKEQNSGEEYHSNSNEHENYRQHLFSCGIGADALHLVVSVLALEHICRQVLFYLIYDLEFTLVV